MFTVGPNSSDHPYISTGAVIGRTVEPMLVMGKSMSLELDDLLSRRTRLVLTVSLLVPP